MAYTLMAGGAVEARQFMLQPNAEKVGWDQIANCALTVSHFARLVGMVHRSYFGGAPGAYNVGIA
jgi:hypothetical protein